MLPTAAIPAPLDARPRTCGPLVLQFWPLVTLTLTCFGFDSARFGNSTFSTPSLQVAWMPSVLTAFGKLKLG